jgi:hypothetical protein
LRLSIIKDDGFVKSLFSCTFRPERCESVFLVPDAKNGSIIFIFDQFSLDDALAAKVIEGYLVRGHGFFIDTLGFVGLLLLFGRQHPHSQLLTALPVFLISAADRNHIVSMKLDGHFYFHVIFSFPVCKKRVVCTIIERAYPAASPKK